jgi:spore coat protein H
MTLRQLLRLGIGCSLFLALVAVVSAQGAETLLPASDSDSVFGLTRVWKIHLHLTADNWKAMQPTRGGMPSFGGPPGSPGPQGPGGFRPGSFGFEFDYVKADIELNGESFKDIGVRFKGNGTYMMSASSRKRPLKIDFNRFVEDQRFHGLQQLNLHNNVMDPTHVRQALSYPVFQAAGVPAPRTAFAEISLTIDGECDRELLGLYTMVEDVDKAFLKRHFQTSKGMLLKPEGTQGLEYKGEDWTAYEWYEPKTNVKKSDARRFIGALRLVHQADDETFRREIGSYLDIDEFARFLAVNTLLSNMDSFLTHVHNYYLYLSPASNKLMVLPWDMDLSMGAFFLAGSVDQLQELSISHPHVGSNKLLDRLLAWDEFDRSYREHLRKLTDACFGENGSTRASLPAVQAAIKDLVAADAKLVASRPAGPRGGPGPGMFANPPPLETFMTKRHESILAQLDGKSKGRAPGMGFGPGGPRPGGPGFGPGNVIAGILLKAGDQNQDQKASAVEFTDVGKKWFRDWDKDENKSLTNDEVAAGLNDALPPPPNAPQGGRPFAGFGPGNFLGPMLARSADADKDGLVSSEEWDTAFQVWFKEWDKNSDDMLENAEFAAGLNRVFGPPPGPPANRDVPQ